MMNRFEIKTKVLNQLIIAQQIMKEQKIFQVPLNDKEKRIVVLALLKAVQDVDK